MGYDGKDVLNVGLRNRKASIIQMQAEATGFGPSARCVQINIFNHIKRKTKRDLTRVLAEEMRYGEQAGLMNKKKTEHQLLENGITKT